MTVVPRLLTSADPVLLCLTTDSLALLWMYVRLLILGLSFRILDLSFLILERHYPLLVRLLKTVLLGLLTEIYHYLRALQGPLNQLRGFQLTTGQLVLLRLKSASVVLLYKTVSLNRGLSLPIRDLVLVNAFLNRRQNLSMVELLNPTIG